MIVKLVLTPRETEVVMLVAGGFTTEEICEKLHNKKRTVDFHLANVYSKHPKITNRVQLARAWMGLPVKARYRIESHETKRTS